MWARKLNFPKYFLIWNNVLMGNERWASFKILFDSTDNAK